jgi:hypothetical protein
MNPASIFFMWVIWFVRPRKRPIKVTEPLILDIVANWNTGPHINCPSHDQIRKVLLLAERLQ